MPDPTDYLAKLLKTKMTSPQAVDPQASGGSQLADTLSHLLADNQSLSGVGSAGGGDTSPLSVDDEAEDPFKKLMATVASPQAAGAPLARPRTDPFSSTV